MSKYEQKPGEGTVWLNTGDNKAVYSGRILLLDGSEAYIDLYRAERRDGTAVLDKEGNEFFNVRIKPKGQQGQRSNTGGGQGQTRPPQRQAAQQNFRDDFEDSDIPF